MKFLPSLLVTLASLLSGSLVAQIGFTKRTDLLTPANHYSGIAIGVTDVNGDGLDDIIRLNQGKELSVSYQTAPNQPFTLQELESVSNESQWGMCAADVDNNGYTDFMSGGSYDGIKFITANEDGSVYNMVNMTAPQTFVQNVNFADVNNDGWLDAFVCHDDGVARIFGNNGDGTFTYQQNWIDLTTVPASDNSGNYGSIWSDVNNDGLQDLYIAKCRQGVNSPTDPRRINQLFLNNGDGTYSQDITNASGLRIGAQSWTADFGDIDNDGDFDCFITNHDVSSQLLENDGAGHFTDISAAAGILNAIPGTHMQGVFRDFDNDGYVDILVSGSSHYLIKNNGNKTFTVTANLFDNNDMESFAIGDLNNDGFQDIYAGYGQIYTTPSNIPDALWLNNRNSNNYFGLNLRGVQANRNGIGSKIYLYSALGIQVREVHSGQSYGIMNSMQVHFGMGQETQIDSVVVYWPSGTHDVLPLPAVNEYITLYEGGCQAPPIEITAAGSTTFCTGQSVQLDAPAEYTYEWSSGETTQSITVTAEGNYKVTATNAEGCSTVSNVIRITVDPVETPTLTVQGDTVFCAGGAVQLSSSTASGYTWSNGATTQSISVSEPGTYFVTTQGLCNTFSSTSVSVNVLNSEIPVVTGDTIAIDSSATLSASGANLQWYENQTDVTPVFSGDVFETPGLGATTVYWVSSTTTFDTPNEFVGMVDHQGATSSDNSYNGTLIFDCFAPFKLSKVKVYTTKAGTRKVDLQNSAGQILQSTLVDIPVGTSVIDLDFDISVGTDYILTTDPTVNQTFLGTSGPQLYRSNQGITFPYVIDEVVSIKNSSFGLERYYYFFNWEIDFNGYECTSERIPVTAFVDSTIVSAPAPVWASDLRIYPNPTSGNITTEMDGYSGGKMTVTVKNAQGSTLQTRRLELPAGAATFQTDLAQYPKGIYWLDLATEKGAVQRRVVVQ
ncbi:MAG TPA: FG-GAP-like repeat-containing protein [Saprospiraceae bacterium]|nr:FG-GAP-like repeat-containing protein [Saprospiraceae bacterium]